MYLECSNIPYLERFIPRHGSGSGAGDAGSDGHGLGRGWGREELLEDLAVQVSLLQQKTKTAHARARETKRHDQSIR